MCDGRPDCLRSGEDEWGCLGLKEGVLDVGPQHLPVCWEGWEESAGEAACHQLGFAGMQNAEFHQVPQRKGPWWLWRGGSGEAADWVQAQGEAGECESGTTVKLQCKPHRCGGWGKKSTVPSLALLLHVASRKSCPASLISATHLMAASSCFDPLTLDPKQWVVFPELSSSRKIKVISAITKLEEVILLRMASPATLGPASQPACLPSPSTSTPGDCVLAYWAVADQGDVSFAQHVAPLSPLSTSCPPNLLCTKPLPSSPSPLPGSPLLCSQPQGTWALRGLLLGPGYYMFLSAKDIHMNSFQGGQQQHTVYTSRRKKQLAEEFDK